MASILNSLKKILSQKQLSLKQKKTSVQMVWFSYSQNLYILRHKLSNFSFLKKEKNFSLSFA